MNDISERTVIIVALIIGATITASTGHSDIAGMFGVGILWTLILL